MASRHEGAERSVFGTFGEEDCVGGSSRHSTLAVRRTVQSVRLAVGLHELEHPVRRRQPRRTAPVHVAQELPVPDRPRPELRWRQARAP